MSTRFDIGVFFKLFDKFSGPAKRLSRSANNLQKKFGQMGSSFITAGRNLTKYVTLPIIGLGTYAVRNAIKMEKWGIAFETLLGSSDKAASMMKQLREMTQQTPFEFGTLVEGARFLKVMRVEQKALLPVMRALGDVALGDNEKFNRLALVYGKVSNMGRLLAKQNISFALAGFNPLAFLAEKTGKSMDFFRAKMRAGQLSLEDVTEALMYATSEGQMFFEGTEKLANTLYGKLSILRDNIFLTSEGFGTLLMPAVERLTVRITDFAKSMDKLNIGQKENINLTLGWLATIGPVALGLGVLITTIGKLLLLKAALAAFGISLGIAFAPLLVLVGLVATVAAADALLRKSQAMRKREQAQREKMDGSPLPGGKTFLHSSRSLGAGTSMYGGMMAYTGLPLKGPGESYGYQNKMAPGYNPGGAGYYPSPTEIIVKVEVDDGLVAQIEKNLQIRKDLKVKAEVNSSLGRYLNMGKNY